MSIRDIVYAEVEAVAKDQGKTLPTPLTDSLNIMASGLDSLGTAILIAALDEKTGLQPYDMDGMDLPISIGDLIRAYEKASEHAAA